MGFLDEDIEDGQLGHIEDSEQLAKKVNGLVADLRADFGAVEGGPDCTAAYEAAKAALLTRGGGTVWVPQGDWVGIWEMTDHVGIAMAPGGVSTLRPYSDETPGVVFTDGAPLNGTNLTAHIAGDGNPGQWALYAKGDGDGAGGDGGWWYSTIDVSVAGTDLLPGALWLRGGGDDGLNPHQFLKIRLRAKDEDGLADWIGAWITGQVGQVEFELLDLQGNGSVNPTTDRLLRIEQEVDDDGDVISDRSAYNLKFDVLSLQGARHGALVHRAQDLTFVTPHLENVRRCFDIDSSAVAIVIDNPQYLECGVVGAGEALAEGSGYLVRVGGTSAAEHRTPTWSHSTATKPDAVFLRDGPGALLQRGGQLPSGHTSANALYSPAAAASVDIGHARYVGIVGNGVTVCSTIVNSLAEGELLHVLALSGDVLYATGGNLVFVGGSSLEVPSGAVTTWIRQGTSLWLVHGGEGSAIS